LKLESRDLKKAINVYNKNLIEEKSENNNEYKNRSDKE